MYECYLCGCELEEKATTTSKNHKEHIIPQALGGHLIATGILCRECGGEKYLSRALDKPFADLFKSIAIRLDVRKDRGSKSKIKSISAKLKPFKSTEEIDVNITQDKKISYRRPSQKIDTENKIIYVYGNKKTAKDYKKKVLKNIKDTLESYEEYEVKVISDLSKFQEFDGVLEFPFNLNNEVLIKSLNKIAIEFALLKGVEISEITHLVDREKRQIRNNNNTLPYFPIEPIEYELEYKRPIYDPNYISHSLALFIQKYQTKEKEVKQVLTCFIELFGTFQFFVVLNSDYKGKDIGFKSYSQRLQKEEIAEYKPKPNQITPNEISIHLDTLNISSDEIKGMRYDDLAVLICEKYERRENSKYIFSYGENIESIVNQLIVDLVKSTDRELLLSAYRHFYNGDDFKIENFRSQVQTNEELNKSILYEIEELYQTDKEMIREYIHAKFRSLESYIDIYNLR